MLSVKHIELKEANRYVYEHHRHNPPVQGHKFSIGCFKDGELCGVAIVGHPQGRMSNDGDTLEVLRLCTNGDKNACSILYGRCARIGHELGYSKIITYILISEPGTSLKASGWKCENDLCGGKGKWTGKRQNEREKYKQISLFPQKEQPKERKQLWTKNLNY